jgi:hypothetical protein
MSSFTYSSLYGRRVIRLLDFDVGPVADDDRLRCNLVGVRLQAEPAYDAISYAWNDEQLTVPNF